MKKNPNAYILRPPYLYGRMNNVYREAFVFEYCLDVSKQYELMHDTKPLHNGLKETFEWYRNHSHEVAKKPYIHYIDEHLK